MAGAGVSVQTTATGPYQISVPAPPGTYWNTPNTLAEIPSPAVGGAAGATAGAYASGALSGLTSALGLTGTSTAGSSGVLGAGTAGVGGVVGGTTGATGYVPSIAPVDTSAATSAAFGAAKDTAGQTAASELASLRGVLGETGQLGGGAESQAAQQIVEQAANQVGDVNRQSAITNAQNAQQDAIANYQGGITQRGQDIQSQEAAAQLALSASNAATAKQLALLQQAGAGLASLY